MATAVSGRQITRERPLYDAEELRALVRPASIAIIGVSARGSGFGSNSLRELVDAGYAGPLYVVSKSLNADELPDQVQLVGSIGDLPDPVDCVLVAVPAPAVEGIVEDAAARGCKSVLVFTSGFGETVEGKEAENRLRAISERTGIRIGGPNTAGILNYRDKIPLCFFSDLGMDLPSGNLAIVSQSGGLATHLGHRRHRGMGVSYTITTGNSVDVTALDYVNFLIDDDSTRVIVLMVEGITNGEGLAVVGRRARAAGKPLLVLKSGRTSQGERAAISHTGSLAGSYDVFLEAADDAGLLVFQSTELLLETAQLFADWIDKPYREGGVAILTTMGGPGVMAADAAEDCGIDLPIPAPDTAKRLSGLMPAFAAAGNPVDTSAFQSDDLLRQSLETLASDDQYSAVVMLTSTITGAATAKRPYSITAAAENASTPICAVWLSSWQEGPGSEILDQHRSVPVFRTVENCMQAIAHWQAWHRYSGGELENLEDQPAVPSERLMRLMETLSDATGVLDEAMSRTLLDAIDIPSARAGVARTADEAVRLAVDIGFPIVAKVVSADIPHKAKVGGVKLGLEGEASVRAAFDTIMNDVRRNAPSADLGGILIAEMVPANREFMAGVVRDPVFGPVVLCGAGGSSVEEMADISRCIAPITSARASRAIRATRLFQNVLSKQPEQAARIEQELVHVMKGLGSLALNEERLCEIDINPLVLREDGHLVALDALAVMEK